MPGQNIDSLNIRIESEVSGALSSLDKLSNKLETTGSWLTRFSSKFKMKDIGSNSAIRNMGKEYDKLRDRIISVTNELNKYRKISDKWDGKFGISDASWDALTGKIVDAEDELERLTSLMDKLNKGFKISDKDILGGSETGEESQRFDRLRKAMEQIRGVVGTVKSAFNGLSSTLRTIGSHISTVVNGFRKLYGAMTGASKNAQKSSKTFKQVARTVLRYGFGIRSFYFLFRRLRKAIKEGFTNLAQYSDEVRNAGYQISAALMTVKNAFAAGFSPIATVVAPYIQQFLNLIASALNAIGRFLSVLTGKGFAVQAIKISAGAMSNLSSETGSAASNAKKLEKALSVLPFDELNQLNGDKNSSGSGGSGGGGGASGLSASEMFETVELNGDEYIQNWAERMRKAFLSEDWERLGSEIADGLNTGISKINKVFDWEKNGANVRNFIRKLTTTLNSLNSNLNWELIGDTVAGGINTISGAITAFADNMNWNAIGSSLGTALNTMLDGVDWASVGNAFTVKFKIALEGLSGFVTSTDWAKLGTAIGEFIIGALETVNLPQLGTTLAQLMNGAFTSAIAMIRTGALGRIVSDLGDAIVNFSATVDWPLVGRTIGEGLASIDWGKALSDMATAIWYAITGLFKGLAESGGLLPALGIAAGVLFGKKLLAGIGSLLASGGGALGKTILSGLASFVGSTAGLASLGGLGAFLVYDAGSKIQQLNWERKKKQYGINDESLALAGISESELKKKLIEIRSSTGGMNANYGGVEAELKAFARDYGVKSAMSFAEGYTDTYVYALANGEQKIQKILGSWSKVQKRQEKNFLGYGKADATALVNGFKKKVKLMVNAGEESMSNFLTGQNKSMAKVKRATENHAMIIADMYDIHEKTESMGKKANEGFLIGVKNTATNVSGVLTTVQDKLKSIFNVQSASQDYGKRAGDGFFAKVKASADSATSTITAIQSKLKGIFNVESAAKHYGQQSGKGWLTKVNESPTTFKSMVDSITSKLKGLFNVETSSKSAGEKAASWFYAGIENYSWFSNIGDKLYKGFTAAQVENEVKKAARRIGNWISGNMDMNIALKVQDAGREKQQKFLVDIIPNARGGLYDAATIIGYQVGEAGKEAILPLENKRTMDMIANSIMGGSDFGGLANQIVEGVAQVMMSASNNQVVNVNATLYTEDNEVLARAVNRGNRAISYRENVPATSRV